MSYGPHRRAIVGLTIAFVALSALLHFSLGGLGTGIHFSSAPIPEQSPILVTISKFSTPTPTPVPTPAPSPVHHFTQAHNPAFQQRLPSSGQRERTTSRRDLAATPLPIAVVESTAPIASQTESPSPVETPIDARDRVVGESFRHEVKPVYPDIAKDGGQEGTVVVLVTIGPDGMALDARIAQSSGSPAIDQAALRAAKASLYYPAEIDGKPAIMTCRIIYTFQLT